ncbi:MAG TPA: HAD-IIA family hydrolase [Candidatus Methylomirabilis sp.]|jgi:NagD protein|nr:HAD-IIA family hydrolase [Candidatus Methylomirabilis sp.]
MRFQGYVFDLDGTIYRGPRMIDGAAATVRALRERGAKVCFLSNKPIESRARYAEKLRGFGIAADLENVVNSSYVMARYLAARDPGAPVYVIGEPPLKEELTAAGLTVLQDPTGVRYLIIAFDRTFDYGKLRDALIAVRRGARMLATNPDRTCPTEEGEIPDAAGMIGAVEAVTNRKVELVVGKPNRIMLDVALERLGLPPGACLMVGDRLETDIAMGRAAGMPTALVLTGVTRREELAAAPVRPDYILESIRDLLTLDP